MKIIMKESFQITEEIEKIACGYDFHAMYIDNYGQMKDAESKNQSIMQKLNELGVEKLEQ